MDNHCLKNQIGSSLIEILITLFILSIALLTFIETELTALQTTQNSHLHSMAILNNESMAEYLRACEQSLACRDHQKKQWMSQVSTIFPRGKAKLSKKNFNYFLEIHWSDPIAHSFRKTVLETRPCK